MNVTRVVHRIIYKQKNKILGECSWGKDMKKKDVKRKHYANVVMWMKFALCKKCTGLSHVDQEHKILVRG